MTDEEFNGHVATIRAHQEIDEAGSGSSSGSEANQLWDEWQNLATSEQRDEVARECFCYVFGIAQEDGGDWSQLLFARLRRILEERKSQDATPPNDQAH